MAYIMNGHSLPGIKQEKKSAAPMKASPAKDTKGEGSYGGSTTKDKDGKITAASKRVLELRKEHNASSATKGHFGDPHGDEPS